MPTADAECLDRLHCAGWTIGDTAFRSPDGRLVWLVSGRNGENQIRAEGATAAEAITATPHAVQFRKCL
jgi:hypothetical protein